MNGLPCSTAIGARSRSSDFGTTLQFSAEGLVAQEASHCCRPIGQCRRPRRLSRWPPRLCSRSIRSELGAIMRRPFTHYDGTDYVVFGIDRGEGGSLPPILPSEPSVTADAIVTIAVGPNGSTYSGTVTDRLTGVTQTIDPRNIQVRASVVRVLLAAASSPRKASPSPSTGSLLGREPAQSLDQPAREHRAAGRNATDRSGVHRRPDHEVKRGRIHSMVTDWPGGSGGCWS